MPDLDRDHPAEPGPPARRPAADAARTGPAVGPLSAGGMLSMQRAAGNAATAAALDVQRWTNSVLSFKSNAELVRAALDDDDAGAAKQINDVKGVPVPDILKLIDLLNRKGSTWGRDVMAMLLFWESVGPDLITVANADGGARWKLSVAKVPTLTSDLPAIAALKTAFPKDVLALAQSTLADNRTFVVKEMGALGISTDPTVTGAQLTTGQHDRMRDLQDAAAVIARLQAAQEHARTLNVGWRLENLDGAPPPASLGGTEGAGYVPPSTGATRMYVPVTFDPFAKPELDQAPVDAPLIPVVGRNSVVPYAQVNTLYATATSFTELFLEKYPEVYAITRDGKSASTAAFAQQKDMVAARDQIGVGMHKLIGDIEGAQTKLGEDLDPLDLVPLHARMTGSGLKPAGGTIAWNEPVAALAAKEVVGDHDFQRALRSMAIDVAANALFMVAPLTGAGAMLVMLAGIGVLGAKAKFSADRAAALTQAAGTAAAPGTALVDAGTVDMATKQAEADKVAVELAVLQAGVDAAVGSAVQSGTRVAELEGQLSGKLANPLLHEGPNTHAYIDATGPRVRAYESETIQVLGEEHGCHSCGKRDAGKYGTWIGDHQPPTGLVRRGIVNGQQILVPHCESCSGLQSVLVREITELWSALQVARGRPAPPGVLPPVVVPPTAPTGGRDGG
ncbi:hypothetical protein AB0M43_07085 [Longispora sp. NPDC051575]|uniref:hypothetical protein n=1 Tax=Longispora sp. NPDC051575 TaxID=3154943 RepID=UPI0034377DAE